MVSLLSAEMVFARQVWLTYADSRSAVERNVLPVFRLPLLPALGHEFLCLWGQIISMVHK